MLSVIEEYFEFHEDISDRPEKNISKYVRHRAGCDSVYLFTDLSDPPFPG